MLETLLKMKIKRPFGIFLSGGLDSGILAALLKPDFAISCNFQGEFYDELEYAYAIVEELGMEHFVIQPDEDDFKETLAQALGILKRPVNSVSIYPWMKIMSAAKDLGAERMVGGEGSDEVFGGYSRYLILKGINDLYENESLKGYKPMLDSIYGSQVAVHSKLCGVSQETLLKRYDEKEGFLNKIGWAEYNESLQSIINMEKKFAEHFGIELYLPFTNRKVLDYGFSLTDEEKIQGEIRKLKVYEIAKKYLPEKVWQRKDKKGFGSPCNEWCGSKSKYDKSKYLQVQKECLSSL